VVLRPRTPHMAAGCRIDPPVSDPSASGVMPAATATADPPLDPPGIRSSAQGLRDGPNAEFSVDDPIANSSQLVLPIRIAPASSMRASASRHTSTAERAPDLTASRISETVAAWLMRAVPWQQWD